MELAAVVGEGEAADDVFEGLALGGDSVVEDAEEPVDAGGLVWGKPVEGGEEPVGDTVRGYCCFAVRGFGSG